MPFISHNKLARIEHSLAKRHHTHSSSKGERTAARAFTAAEVVGSAMLMGFVRGKMEDKSTGAWNVPGTSNIDVELVAGVGLLGASMFNAFGAYSQDAGNAANGILAHYLGQVARKFAHTGQFSLIAGESPRQLMSGNPYQSQSVLADALRQGV